MAWAALRQTEVSPLAAVAVVHRAPCRAHARRNRSNLFRVRMMPFPPPSHRQANHQSNGHLCGVDGHLWCAIVNADR